MATAAAKPAKEAKAPQKGKGEAKPAKGEKPAATAAKPAKGAPAGKKAAAPGAKQPKAEQKVVRGQRRSRTEACDHLDSARPSHPRLLSPSRLQEPQMEGFRHIPVSVHDRDAVDAPPAELHVAFLRLAASLTSRVYVEAASYARQLIEACREAVRDYVRPAHKVRDGASLSVRL